MRTVSDVTSRDRFSLENTNAPEQYIRGWNQAMDHVRRECLPEQTSPAPLDLRLKAALIERAHDWPGLAELADGGGA